MATLNNLAEEINSLEIAWMKAHVAYNGNERAEKLANQAMSLILPTAIYFAIMVQKKGIFERKPRRKYWTRMESQQNILHGYQKLSPPAM